MDIVELFDSDSDEDRQADPQSRIFRLRQYYVLENFDERFGLSRFQFEQLLQTIGNDIESPTARSHALTPTDKLLAALRFYACGIFNYTIGDCQGPKKSSICCAVCQVTAILNLRLFQQTICWPQPVSNLANRFFQFAEMPSVAGKCSDQLFRVVILLSFYV